MITSFVMLAVIGIGLLIAHSAGSSDNPTTKIGLASPGSVEQFNYLNSQFARCSWGWSAADATRWATSLADNTFVQGPCCNGMVLADYQKQVSELSNYTSLSSVVAQDPYNIPAPVLKADLAGLNLTLTPSQQSVFNAVPALSSENWCCCQCWAWYQHQGLGKILIADYGYSAQEVAHVIDLEGCCGTAPGPMNMS